eukprot:m51a1_g8103 putative kinesin-like protein kif3a isoform x2 (700) ;mRNA; f:92033-94862
MAGKGAEAIKVVMRCRPLNKTELADQRKAIVEVDMARGEVKIPNPAEPGEPPKVFNFDCVFDSGATQQLVFDKAANNIVQACLDGFNGTGKTFSMTGVIAVPELRGIIPRSFARIFDYVNSTQGIQFLVRASYLEIYNEQLRDLLSDDPTRKLDLKQHPQHGVFVKDLSAFAVKNEQEMDEIMTRGAGNRVVAFTKMNEGSSRSHAIFTVTVEANEKDAAGEDHIRVGKLNLVDLAGSERAGKTECTGERLKEGCAINLSLTALGNVISALVDGKSKHVPYRDSKLTRLLEDSLGGSAKTAMVANIGPADHNYDETISTLRYASRAKNIKNKPKINEDPKDALLRELSEEIKQLKAELASIGGEGQAVLAEVAEMTRQAGIDPAIVVQLKAETEEKIKSILQEKGVLEEERNKIAAALASYHEKESQEREMREAVEQRIKALEGSICVGGVNLFEENQQVSKEVAEAKQALQQQNAAQLQLQAEIERQREEDLTREEKYASLQEEVAGKSEKLAKLQARIDYYDSELSSIRHEWEREKGYLLQSFRELQQEMRRKQLVIDFFVPDAVQKVMTDHARWDEENNEWLVHELHLAGNIAGPPPADDNADEGPDRGAVQCFTPRTCSETVVYFSLTGGGGGGGGGSRKARPEKRQTHRAKPPGSSSPSPKPPGPSVSPPATSPVGRKAGKTSRPNGQAAQQAW